MSRSSSTGAGTSDNIDEVLSYQPATHTVPELRRWLTSQNVDLPRAKDKASFIDAVEEVQKRLKKEKLEKTKQSKTKSTKTPSSSSSSSSSDSAGGWVVPLPPASPRSLKTTKRKSLGELAAATATPSSSNREDETTKQPAGKKLKTKAMEVARQAIAKKKAQEAEEEEEEEEDEGEGEEEVEDEPMEAPAVTAKKTPSGSGVKGAGVNVSGSKVNPPSYIPTSAKSNGSARKSYVDNSLFTSSPAPASSSSSSLVSPPPSRKKADDITDLISIPPSPAQLNPFQQTTPEQVQQIVRRISEGGKKLKTTIADKMEEEEDEKMEGDDEEEEEAEEEELPKVEPTRNGRQSTPYPSRPVNSIVSPPSAVGSSFPAATSSYSSSSTDFSSGIRQRPSAAVSASSFPYTSSTSSHPSYHVNGETGKVKVVGLNDNVDGVQRSGAQWYEQISGTGPLRSNASPFTQQAPAPDNISQFTRYSNFKPTSVPSTMTLPQPDQIIQSKLTTDDDLASLPSSRPPSPKPSRTSVEGSSKPSFAQRVRSALSWFFTWVLRFLGILLTVISLFLVYQSLPSVTLIDGPPVFCPNAHTVNGTLVKLKTPEVNGSWVAGAVRLGGSAQCVEECPDGGLCDAAGRLVQCFKEDERMVTDWLGRGYNCVEKKEESEKILKAAQVLVPVLQSRAGEFECREKDADNRAMTDYQLIQYLNIIVDEQYPTFPETEINNNNNDNDDSSTIEAEQGRTAILQLNQAQEIKRTEQKNWIKNKQDRILRDLSEQRHAVKRVQIGLNGKTIVQPASQLHLPTNSYSTLSDEYGFEAIHSSRSFRCILYSLVYQYKIEIFTTTASLVFLLWSYYAIHSWRSRRQQIKSLSDRCLSILCAAAANSNGDPAAAAMAIDHLRDTLLPNAIRGGRKGKADMALWEAVCRQVQDSRVQMTRVKKGQTPRDAWVWTGGDLLARYANAQKADEVRSQDERIAMNIKNIQNREAATGPTTANASFL